MDKNVDDNGLHHYCMIIASLLHRYCIIEMGLSNPRFRDNEHQCAADHSQACATLQLMACTFRSDFEFFAVPALPVA